MCTVFVHYKFIKSNDFVSNQSDIKIKRGER